MEFQEFILILFGVIFFFFVFPATMGIFKPFLRAMPYKAIYQFKKMFTGKY